MKLNCVIYVMLIICVLDGPLSSSLGGNAPTSESSQPLITQPSSPLTVTEFEVSWNYWEDYYVIVIGYISTGCSKLYDVILLSEYIQVYIVRTDPQLRGARGRSPPGSNLIPEVFWIVIYFIYSIFLPHHDTGMFLTAALVRIKLWTP